MSEDEMIELKEKFSDEMEELLQNKTPFQEFKTIFLAKKSTLYKSINKQTFLQKITGMASKKDISLDEEHLYMYILRDALEHSTNIELIEFLIDQGADVNDTYKNPLVLTIKLYTDDENTSTQVDFYIKAIALLLSRGADPHLDKKTLLSELCDKSNERENKVADDLKVMRLFVDYKYDLNKVNYSGETFLHECDFEEDRHLIKFALENGADANIKDDDENTALNENFTRLTTDLLQIFLDNNWDVNTQNKSKQTLFHQLLARRKKDMEVFKLLIKSGANLSLLDNKNKMVLDHVYALNNNYCDFEALEEILKEKGAVSTYKKDNYLLDKLCVDVIEGDRVRNMEDTYIRAKKLLEEGADVNIQNPTDSERTPLHAAIEWDSWGYNSINFVKLFLEYGAKTDIVDSYYGLCVLHDAVRFERIEIIEYLLKNGADVNVKSHRGMTPLAGVQDVEILKLLLDYGAEVNPYFAQMTVTIHRAEVALLERIVKQGVDMKEIYGYDKFLHHILMPTWNDYEGETFCNDSEHTNRLSFAKDIVEKVQVLLDYGLDMDFEDEEGKSIAHYAAQGGHLGVLQLLKANNCNFFTKTSRDETTLFLAAQFGCYEAVKFLLEEGINPNEENDCDETALDDGGSEAREGFDEIEKLLQTYVV